MMLSLSSGLAALVFMSATPACRPDKHASPLTCSSPSSLPFICTTPVLFLASFQHSTLAGASRAVLSFSWYKTLEPTQTRHWIPFAYPASGHTCGFCWLQPETTRYVLSIHNCSLWIAESKYLLYCMLSDRHEGFLEGGGIDVKEAYMGAYGKPFQACAPPCLLLEVSAQLRKGPVGDTMRINLQGRSCHVHAHRTRRGTRIYAEWILSGSCAADTISGDVVTIALLDDTILECQEGLPPYKGERRSRRCC